MKKYVAAVCVLLVAGVVGPAAAVADSQVLPEIELRATPFFSPNGDRVQDRAAVRFTLSEASEQVTLRVVDGNGRARRVKDFGALDAGAHRWTWDGRRGNAELARDGRYRVEVTAVSPNGIVSAERWVVLDTSFQAWMWVERFGAPASAPDKVYPRSTELVDALPITAFAERSLDHGSLVIRDDADRVVLRRDMKDGTTDGADGWSLDLAWTGRRGGKPLPVGRYRAVVVGTDKAGNHGRSKPLPLFVSGDRLVWHDETRTMAATETTVGCEISTGNDCGLDFYCGTVKTSNLFAGGLSHLSAPCPSDETYASIPEARSWHLLTVPEAVHGIRLARVAFAGSPTYAGEADPGTLRFGEVGLTSSSGAQSGWLEPPLGNGRPAHHSSRIPPSVFWTFGTTGDDAFDVGTFTVDLHYAAVE